MIRAVASKLDEEEDSGEHAEGEEKNTDHIVKQTSQTKDKSSDKKKFSSLNNRTCDMQKSAGRLRAQIKSVVIQKIPQVQQKVLLLKHAQVICI